MAPLVLVLLLVVLVIQALLVRTTDTTSTSSTRSTRSTSGLVIRMLRATLEALALLVPLVLQFPFLLPKRLVLLALRVLVALLILLVLQARLSLLVLLVRLILPVIVLAQKSTYACLQITFLLLSRSSYELVYIIVIHMYMH
jgi:hypothetical protein